MKRTTILALAFLSVAAAAGFAYGGGGAFSGASLPATDWTNTGLRIAYTGGFGYGVTDDGHRIGGFGVGVSTEDGRELGGFGGIINGQQVRIGPLTASVNTWIGVGGLSLPSGTPREFFGYFAEINGEIGLAVLPWFQVSGYVGMQAMGNLIPGDAFTGNAIYTPVSGIRLAWGSF